MEKIQVFSETKKVGKLIKTKTSYETPKIIELVVYYNNHYSAVACNQHGRCPRVRG